MKLSSKLNCMENHSRARQPGSMIRVRTISALSRATRPLLHSCEMLATGLAYPFNEVNDMTTASTLNLTSPRFKSRKTIRRLGRKHALTGEFAVAKPL